MGLEALRQLEKAGDYPDTVIGCFGGGSNFSGISFPFLHRNLTEGKGTRIIAVEPGSCPKLTRSRFMYDFGDTAGLTPLISMYSIGHCIIPLKIHAGELRHHGAGPIMSQLLRVGLIGATSVGQSECFRAGLIFARSEGIIPAPETTHAIAQVVREAARAWEEGKPQTMLFNFSGHGLMDLSAYESFFAGELKDYQVTDEEIMRSIGRSELQPV
ncbi:MAG: pyridoxal-phosphate dependent enzyme [Bacteroidales bacterium]|nr:pyridoxal-phosphate dependent enzyme [Bacteroidales bacterium]